MSSLLEQAIIDATALKEAALKNAEAQVLERYSTDVKEALRNLLEQVFCLHGLGICVFIAVFRCPAEYHYLVGVHPIAFDLCCEFSFGSIHTMTQTPVLVIFRTTLTHFFSCCNNIF